MQRLGRLLVDKRGRLVLIDFGLCANVAQPDTKSMTSAIVHLMTGDVERLLDDAIRLGFLPEDVDKVKLLPALEKIFHDAKLKDEVTAAMTDAACIVFLKVSHHFIMTDFFFIS